MTEHLEEWQGEWSVLESALQRHQDAGRTGRQIAREPGQPRAGEVQRSIPIDGMPPEAPNLLSPHFTGLVVIRQSPHRADQPGASLEQAPLQERTGCGRLG
jgi:hypothetical protein